MAAISLTPQNGCIRMLCTIPLATGPTRHENHENLSTDSPRKVYTESRSHMKGHRLWTDEEYGD